MSDEQPTSRRAARAAAARGGRRGASRGAKRAESPAGATSAAASSADGDGAPPPKGGILGAFRAHPTATLLGALSVLFLLLGTGAVFAGVTVGSSAAAEPTATPTPEPPRPVPDVELAASTLRTCSITPLTGDQRLGSFYGTVVDIETGEVLFDRRGDQAIRTASVLKVLTAAAALAVLGPDHRIATSVVDGSTAGSIVLVGRGDATLSATAPGSESVYRGAPKLADLAAQTLGGFASRHPGEQITSLVLDASYWSVGDKWDSSWARSEQTIGYHSEVTALQVDGDRADPARATSPRSTDPVARAGQLFLQALRAADTEGIVADSVAVAGGSAVGGTPELARVESQPVSALVTYMLEASDNTLAEMLARVTSKESALDGSAASLQQAIPSALTSYGVAQAGLTIRDGSGLSHLNGVPSQWMAQFMAKVAGGDQNLDIIRDALPVAGQSGTLASRFTGDNAVARGAIIAKTGWISSARTLAGVIASADGTRLAFAFYAVKNGIGTDAMDALDTIATGAWRCGGNLSNT